MDAIASVLGNAGWMAGNLFLAWAPVLFALHLRGSERAARLASIVLITAAPLMLAVRIAARGGFDEAPARAVLVVGLVGTFAVAWSLRARAGDRWAKAVGYVGVIAFAPNAPYVMTDLFHHVQSVRIAGGSLAGNIAAAIMYGWFLVLGVAAWIALVDIGRSWLRRHWTRLPGFALLLVASLVFSFGIYLGRIERFHSWHPLGEPVRFVREVGAALTSTGPVAFTLVWWVVLVVVALVGLRLLDAARAGDGVAALVDRAAWTLTGILLAASPLVPIGYELVGASVPRQSALVAVSSVLLGVLLVTMRWREHPWFDRRVTMAGAAASIVVPLVAVLVSIAAMTQWYAQFRGLCEHGPAVNYHGDVCN